MNKQQKVKLVEDLATELKNAKSIVLINYSGLSVKAQQDLKKRLKEADSRMLVIKNTLLKRAGSQSGISDKVLTDTVLSGQTALVIGTGDPIAPIQVLGKFAKEADVPKFKMGVIEGSFQDTDMLTKLANLPGRDALLGQILGSLMSLNYGLVGALNGNLQKLVYVLDQKAKS